MRKKKEMSIDYAKNGKVIADNIILLLMWIALWNIVELIVDTLIDHHKHWLKSKYIVYFVLLIVSLLLMLFV